MAATTVLNITCSSLTPSSVKDKFPIKPGDPQACADNLVNELMALACGSQQGSLTIQVQNGDGVAAHGTVTCASVSAADTVTVGNVVFTAVAGTPGAHQFKQGVSNTADGLSLATAINADAVAGALVSASNGSGTVTVTALAKGTAGNGLQLSSSNNTRLAVVAMASGVNDTATTYTQTF